MKRKRITQWFPFLLPIRRKQRKLFFYGMCFDRNHYAKAKAPEFLPFCIYETKSKLLIDLTLYHLADGTLVPMGGDFDLMDSLSHHERTESHGITHIGRLKTRENILREKLQITDRFTQGSILFLNGDDPVLVGLRGKPPYETVFHGTALWYDFRAEVITAQKETTTAFRCLAPGRESAEVTLPALGMHHVPDALAALAVAVRLGVSLDRPPPRLGITVRSPGASRFTMSRELPISIAQTLVFKEHGTPKPYIKRTQ